MYLQSLQTQGEAVVKVLDDYVGKADEDLKKFVRFLLVLVVLGEKTAENARRLGKWLRHGALGAFVGIVASALFTIIMLHLAVNRGPLHMIYGWLMVLGILLTSIFIRCFALAFPRNKQTTD